jgi:uncharacterized membrane protein
MDSTTIQDIQVAVAKGAVVFAGWTTGTYFDMIFTTFADKELNTFISSCVLILTGIYAGMNIYTWLQVKNRKRNANTKRDSK